MGVPPLAVVAVQVQLETEILHLVQRVVMAARQMEEKVAIPARITG
jgi:hypothetical protein